jgi:hypothetical protein
MASPSLIDKMEKLLADSLIPNAQTLIDKIKEVDKAAYDVVKTFGLSNSQVMAIKSSLTGAASEVERLGGKFSDVLSIQTHLGEMTNRNAILMSESFAGIYAASEVSGQTARKWVSHLKTPDFLYIVLVNKWKVWLIPLGPLVLTPKLSHKR